MNHRYLKYLLGTALIGLTGSAFSQTINLYEKACDTSKIITTVQSYDQLMPIFYTEKKDWVKVANPKNGDVGWAKVSELKGPLVITHVNGTTIQQQIVTDKDKSPQVYSVIQYSGPKELKPEEAKEMVRKMEQEQKDMEASMQAMQKHMQDMMQNMFKDFDRSFYTFPVMQPIIVVPEKTAHTEKSDKPKS